MSIIQSFALILILAVGAGAAGIIAASATDKLGSLFRDDDE